jgi:hypothetical protein
MYEETRLWFERHVSPRKATVRDLIEFLSHLTKKHHRKQSLDEYLGMFPALGVDVHASGIPSRNHVFEALARLMLVVQCDSGWAYAGQKKSERRVMAPLHKHYACSGQEDGVVDILESPIDLGSEASQGGMSGVDIELTWTPGGTVGISECHVPVSPTDPHRLLIQCKYFNVESGVASRYGVGELIRQARVAGYSDTTTSYALFVNNAEDLEAALGRKIDKSRFKVSSSKDALIVGLSTQAAWFSALHDMLNVHADLRIALCKTPYPKITLQFHQQYFIEATQRLIAKGQRRFVWGAVPRSGKTYIIAEMVARRAVAGRNAVVLLGAKGDTFSQFERPLSMAMPGMRTTVDEVYAKFIWKGQEVIVMSYQLYKGGDAIQLGKTRRGRKAVTDLMKNSVVDVYYDEMHIGGGKTSMLMKPLLTQRDAIVVGVTATYATLFGYTDSKNKPLFPRDGLITWEYSDQQSMKFCATGRSAIDAILARRTGPNKDLLRDVVGSMFNQYTQDGLDALEREYSEHPTLITWNTRDQEYQYHSDAGRWGAQIVQKLEKDLASLLPVAIRGCAAPVRASTSANSGPYSFLFRLGYDVRTLNNGRNHIQLWFLPYSISKDGTAKKETIAIYARAVEQACRRSSLSQYYEFLNIDTAKGRAKTEVESAFAKSNKRGKSLIVLTAKRLQVGVSLACADIAMNFNHESGIDSQYQTMFRPLTGAPGKSYGYYLDMNPNRFVQFTLSLLDQRRALGGGDQRNKISKQLGEWRYMDVGPEGISDALTAEEMDQEYALVEQEVNTYVEEQKRVADIVTVLDDHDELADMLLAAHADLTSLPKTKTSAGITKSVRGHKGIRDGASGADAEASTGADAGKDADEEADDSRPDESVAEEVRELTKADVAEFYRDVTSLLAIICNTSELKSCAGTAVDEISRYAHNTPCDCDAPGEFAAVSCYLKQVLGMSRPAQRESRKEILQTVADVDRIAHHLQLYMRTVNGTTAGERYLTDVLENIYSQVRTGMGIGQGPSAGPPVFRMWRERKSEMPQQIQGTLEKYLGVRKAHKDKFGEVFTPPSLIECMLDKLAHYDKDVWTNPKGTFLDPAAGICNFSMIAYVKLMNGLTKAFPDEHKRSEHIIRNMLFNVELNTKNVAVGKRIFGPSANIACGSSLEGAWVEGPNGPTWKAGSEKNPITEGVMKFGVVMGNPPYNKPGVSGDSRRQIWPVFIQRGYESLRNSGHLVFVHPQQWRRGNVPMTKGGKVVFEDDPSSAFNILTRKCQLNYLEMHGRASAAATFSGVTLPGYDWYVAEKGGRGTTDYCDIDGKTGRQSFSGVALIPSGQIVAILNTLVSGDEVHSLGDDVIYSRNQYGTDKPWVSQSTQKEGNLVHATNTRAQGGVKYYRVSPEKTKSENVNMFGIPKVIFGDGSTATALYDKDGKYGMTQHAIAMAVGAEARGENITTALTSSGFKNTLQAYLSYSGSFQIDWRVLRKFRKDFYKAFLPGGAIHKLHEEGKLKAPAQRECGYVPPTKDRPASCNGTRKASKSPKVDAEAGEARVGKGRSTRRRPKSSNTNRTRRHPRARAATKGRTRRASRRRN